MVTGKLKFVQHTGDWSIFRALTQHCPVFGAKYSKKQDDESTETLVPFMFPFLAQKKKKKIPTNAPLRPFSSRLDKHKKIFYFNLLLSKHVTLLSMLKFQGKISVPLGMYHTVHTCTRTARNIKKILSVKVSLSSKGEIKKQWKKQSPSSADYTDCKQS